MEVNIKLRPDLKVSPYDDIADRETVVLKDPVAGKYFYLSTHEYQLLKSLDGTISLDLAREKLAETGYYYSPQEAFEIVGKAGQLGLLLGTKFSTSQYQEQFKKNIMKAKNARRFSSLYFLFIPLINPDRFLEKTLPMVRVFGNKWLFGLLALATPLAIYLLISGLPRLDTEYLFFFNLENLLYLWATIALTKLVHEFAHAYVAKSYGLHVPQMGVAFLIFFPCLFCNTTDAWQLADRKQRMAISAAGIIVECAMAVVSIYVWHFTKPGMINSLAFYLVAVSLISTILFNGNPLMRFDGYYILTDLLRLPNLATRSFGYVRYLFMDRVLGIESVPNTATTPREVVIFTTYGISAFLYRVFLYVSITLGVYYRFDKVVGFLLGVLAFALFVILPIYKGSKILHGKAKEVSPRLAGVVVFSIIVIISALVLCIPIAGNSLYPCHLASAKSQKLAVPLYTLVRDVHVREGTHVPAGGLIFALDASQLRLMLTKKEYEMDVARRELALLLLDEKYRGKAEEKAIELRRLEHDWKRIRRDLILAEDGIEAPFDGKVTSLDYRMQDGYQPGEGFIVGEFESTSDCVVHGFIPEHDVEKVRSDLDVEVWFPIGTGRRFKGRVIDLRPYSEKDLKNSPFSSRFGGELATEVKGEGHSDAPLDAQYLCTVKLVDPNHEIPLGMTGRLVVGSPPKSLLGRAWDKLVKTFNRESLL